MSFLGLTAVDATLGAAGLQAGGSLLGGLVGAAGQSASNAQQFAQNEMLFAQQQTANQHFMDQAEGYNTLMANTAYQRSMADMKAAGLNPILAAGGNVTQVGSSPMASVGLASGGQVGNPGQFLGQGIANASQFGQLAIQSKASLSQAGKDDSAADLNKVQQNEVPRVNDALIEKAKQDANYSAKSAERTESEKRANDAAARARDADAANSNSQTVLNGTRNMTEQYNAATAYHNARIAERHADDVVRYGAGGLGSVAADATRTLNTAHDFGVKALGDASQWLNQRGVDLDVMTQRNLMQRGPLTTRGSETPVVRQSPYQYGR